MRLLKTYEKLNKFGIPFGYKRVEYLESTGEQWIDTGINVDTSTDEIKLYFQLTDTALYKWFFGEYDDNARIGLGSGDGPDRRNFLYQQSSTKVTDAQMRNKQHLFEINSNGGFLDGTKIRDYASFASTSTIYLFNLNIDETSDYRCKAKIWKYEHKRNGVTVRDFIPCLDVAGKPCLYDLVNKKTYYNQGTGADFSYGRQITPVEYLENTQTGSSRNWINTGVITDNNTKWEVKIAYNDTNTGKLMGSGIGGNTRFNLGIESSKFRFGFGSGWFDANAEISTPDTNPHTWILDCSTKTGTIDGYPATSSSDFGTNTYPIALFGRTNNVNSTESSNITIGKIYYSKIWQNNILVRDFIPAIDENNVGFMFDLVTNIIYDNAGTGTFLFGEEVYDYKLQARLFRDNSLPAGYTQVEYLESTDGQYIDTGIPYSLGDLIELSVAPLEENVDSVIFGEYSSNTGSIELGCYYGKYRANLQSPSQIPEEARYTIGVKNTLKCIENGQWEINGILLGSARSASNNNSSYLFCRNYPSSPKYSKCRIYSLNIIRNGNMIINFVPAIDPSGVPCMYDRVSKTPFYNQGTGTFVTGKSVLPIVRFFVDPVPIEYKTINYLESTGTQYIDTGYTITEEDNIDATYDIALTNTSGRGLTGYSLTQVGYWGKTASNTYELGGGNTQVTIGNRDMVRFKRDVISTTRQDTDLYVNDILAGHAQRSTTAETGPFQIFACRGGYKMSGKLYGATLTINNKRIRNYIPVLRKSDNKLGMWDTATKQFFTNAGTGEFLYG